MSCKFDSVWKQNTNHVDSSKEVEEHLQRDENIDFKLKKINVENTNNLYIISTVKSFDKFVENEEGLIVLYADWCRICHHSSQDIIRLSKAHKDYKFAVVDCSKKNEIMNNLKIKGVPTYFTCCAGKLQTVKLGTSALKAFEQLKLSND